MLDIRIPQWVFSFGEFWYGFRGTHPSVYYLSPWEFVMWWEVVECSESLHIEEEEKFRVAFPIIPGQVQLAGKFYMKRRCRPVVTRVWKRLHGHWTRTAVTLVRFISSFHLYMVQLVDDHYMLRGCKKYTLSWSKSWLWESKQFFNVHLLTLGTFSRK